MTNDWSEPIFELEAVRPPRWRVPAVLVVLAALVVGSVGVVMTRSPSEEPTVPRPARLPAPMVKVELPAPIVVEAAPAPVKPLERKPRPPSDLLGERL